MPETEKQQLNLDGPITRDEYIGCIRGLDMFLNGELKERNNWCTERHRYFDAIIPEYVLGTNNWGDATGSLDLELVPQEADFAAALREIRAKILWYAKSGTIGPNVANEIFRNAGLPEYGVKPDSDGIRVSVTLPSFELNVKAEDTDSARDWVYDHLAGYITRMMDGKQAQDDDAYVPGSVVIPSGASKISCFVARRAIMIDEADTVRPSYH